MDDNDELDTIVMQDEDKTLDTKSDEVKEEDDQELIIIPFKETCSKHIRGFRPTTFVFVQIQTHLCVAARFTANLYV